MLHAKDWDKSAAHSKKSPMLRNFLTDYIHTSRPPVFVVSKVSISTSLQKIQIGAFCQEHKLKELRNCFQCDLMTNYSDGWIFGSCESIVLSHSETGID